MKLKEPLDSDDLIGLCILGGIFVLCPILATIGIIVVNIWGHCS